ncbi:protein unc-93 homolog A isoform X4 [Ursus americanus]|uniref:protein unc-93 homolog A isoform X4 n=1 Tax=Ursus americanus TaxID=9643 RepID=UPI001E67A854|nr:protein unc-93 homolog A isoform X4 [Ursus americanus]
MERSLKNVLVVSFGFLLLFTAYGGLQSLQSSLYSEEGLGVTALSTLYGGVLLSSMFLPPLLIKKFGCKWTIVISMCCYVAFSLGNFYASWYTLIPTSILLGLGAAPLWSAQCTYLTIMGNTQAEKVGKVGRDVVNRYFGIFFLIFQSSGVWGNLISSLVFGQTPTQGSGVLAVLLVAVFLEPIKDAQQKSEGEKELPFWSTLLSTFRLLRDRRLRLLVLLPMYSGFEQAFLAGDYTRSYTTCALGIQFVGYAMICFSATNSLCSVLYGRLSQHTGRIALYALGAVTHLSCIIALLLWKPHPHQLAVFFVFSGLWGVADAVWQTQNNDAGMMTVFTVLFLPRTEEPVRQSLVGTGQTRLGEVQRTPGTIEHHGWPEDGLPGIKVLYGVLFEKSKEAAFANYRLWEALGFVIAFGYSTFLCVNVKLYVLLGVLSLTMLAYGTVEYLEAKKPARPVATEQTKPADGAETETAM